MKKRTEVCVKCNREWNVGINQKVSEEGYVCPWCEPNRKPKPQPLEVLIARAERKLQWLIDRYGDEGGERRKPYYLGQLIDEEIKAYGLSSIRI